jgi:hypothetical protein
MTSSFTASTVQGTSAFADGMEMTNTTTHRLFSDVEIVKLSLYEGYLLFIGLAIFSFFIARGAVAIRYRIYKDKV